MSNKLKISRLQLSKLFEEFEQKVKKLILNKWDFKREEFKFSEIEKKIISNECAKAAKTTAELIINNRNLVRELKETGVIR